MRRLRAWWTTPIPRGPVPDYTVGMIPAQAPAPTLDDELAEVKRKITDLDERVGQLLEECERLRIHVETLNGPTTT